MTEDKLTFDKRLRLAVVRKQQRARRAVGFPTETSEPTPGAPHIHAGDGWETKLPGHRPTIDDILRALTGR